MSSLADALREGNEPEIKDVIKKTSETPELRSELSRSAAVWQAVSDALGKGITKTLCSLITNLAACEGAGALAYDSGVVSNLIEASASDPGTSLWQALANLSQTLTEHDLSKTPLALAPALAASPLAALRLLEANVRHFPGSILVWAQQGSLSPILAQAPDWYENNDNAILLVTTIFTHAILSDNAPELISLLRDAQHPDWTATLFKIIDASVNRCVDQLTQDVAHNLALALGQQLKDTIALVTPFFGDAIARSEPTSIAWWTCLLANLEVLVIVAPAALDTLSDPENGLIAPLVTLLVQAKQLPQRSKLGDGRHELEPNDFPLVKSTAIPLLSILVSGNPAAQDYVRERGGLGAVLESCTVDENNPFVRESAIVCVRYLLAGNKENQEFVAKLEAKQVVNPDVLEKAGYEAEIVDGNLRVKEKPATKEAADTIRDRIQEL